MATEEQYVPGELLSLAEAFPGVADPRVLGRSKYALVEMLVIGVCAMVCGVEDFVGIETWANERIEYSVREPLVGVPGERIRGPQMGLAFVGHERALVDVGRNPNKDSGASSSGMHPA